MSYQETIDYLYALQKHGIKFGLSNSFLLMELMGNPHKRFRSIHVAGTNGKGSTSAFIASALGAAGRRVGLYTSPHLASFTERIRINNVPITEAAVVELAKRVRERCRGVTAGGGAEPISPTFFEVTTAMAFTHFAEQAVDMAVVEVGMGGRLDSTNVILPLVSVITNIDLEHTEFLGTTLELIAAEKAGIIKPKTPVVTGAVQPEAIRVIEREAAAKGSPVYRMPEDFRPENIARDRTQVFDYQGIGTTYRSLETSMTGRHQADNACLAVAAVECLKSSGIGIAETALRTGLKQAAWEGRLERVARRPDIYLDGAHNPAASKMLRAAVGEMRPSYKRLILLIGILADKDHRGILSELVPLADHVVVTRPEYSRAMDVSRLASDVRLLHHSVETAETVAQAVAKAREIAAEDDLILITGSLYVVGDARAAIKGSADRSSGLAGLKG